MPADFEIPIHLSELVTPSICTGILFTGFILFIYIFSKTKQQLYASMFTFCVLSFVFTISETFIIIFGSYHHDVVFGRQMHRIEQIAGLFFIPAIPYFISSLLEKEGLPARINNALIGGGQTFFNYVNGYRALAAQGMIDDGEKRLSLPEIQYACGIESRLVFNTTFKRLTGSSPRAYYKLNA